MIKAVIFDVGGVLVRTEDYAGRHRWEHRLGLEKRESEAIVFNSEMGLKAQRGEISDKQLWVWVGRRLNLTPDELSQFRQGFWSGDVLDETIVAFVRRLRPRYQTAVISNATDALLDTLTIRYPIADAFDLIVGSATEHVMKPDPVIYQRTIARLGRRADEAVFVDDFIENVTAARQLGMQAIHYRPDVNIAAELEALGVT